MECSYLKVSFAQRERETYRDSGERVIDKKKNDQDLMFYLVCVREDGLPGED